ncbi:MAG: glycosyltransferase [Akkermansiaceae bacterium]|nr:glycosyltransferase [Akkermansiaceae bacterium]
MSRKKIAILGSFPAWLIDETIPKGKGHFAVWLVSLYQALSELSNTYEIHWITFCRGIKKTKRFTSQQQHFHIFPETSLTLGQYTHYIRERFLIKREIKKIAPDIVHAWGTETFYGLAGKDYKNKNILSMQGVLTACVQRAIMPKFQIRQSKYEKSTLNSYCLVTAESPWALDRCKEISNKPQYELFDYSANDLFFHIEREPSSTPSCLLAGTDTLLKDVASAIQAFSQPELSHITLYLAGIPHNRYPNLPSNIIPLGRISREKIAEYLKTTWCLVHPSVADSCPNIVKEARVIGVPCIVTHECGAKQYICNQKSGFVVPIKSPDKIAEAVLKITNSQKTTLNMGAYDLERCRTALSASTMLDNLIKLYNSILNTTP